MLLRRSDRPSIIALPADDVNSYLQEDGIPDVLEARQRAGEMSKPAPERYHKHVKSLVQVGDTPSGQYATVLGYPAAIVPMENPYSIKSGSPLRVKTLVNGKPAGNQYVPYGGLTPNDMNIEPKSVRLTPRASPRSLSAPRGRGVSTSSIWRASSAIPWTTSPSGQRSLFRCAEEPLTVSF